MFWLFSLRPCERRVGGREAVIVDGYVRVSQVGGRSGERFLSPVVQREQIERWAALHGALIGHVFEELDESGGRTDRPLLEAAIARVESGDSEGVVVAYMSRFGRSVMDGLLAIDRITKAGGSFVSVQEGLDFSTDIGRHMLRSMMSWAEWELDRMRTSWGVARERAIARGVFTGGVPFGYRRRRDGRLEIHLERGPVVAELFRLRAEGALLVDLARLLMEKGVKTTTGNSRWEPWWVGAILGKRCYLGEAASGEFVNPSAHRPLIDKTTWENAQFEDVRRRFTLGRGVPLLSGLLRCAGCQRVLRTGARATGSSADQSSYKCGAMKNADACPAPGYVRGGLVEPYVEAIFWEQAALSRRRPTARRVARLREQVERRQGELDAYRDNPRVATTIGPDSFARGLRVRAARVDKARLELSRARLMNRSELPPVAELRERWPSMSVDERRAAIAEVIECVFVRRGKRRPEDRLVLCLRGRAPADLPPSNPRVRIDCQPFDPASCPPPAQLRRSESWSEARLRKALDPFLAGRERWPSFTEFQAAGLALVYVQVEGHGGPQRWARLFGLQYVPPRGEVSAWPNDRIREELRSYFKDKPAWPSWGEFERDGKIKLRRAIKWTGGPERWAPEVGIAMHPRRRNREHWGYARMKEEVARLAAGCSEWPAKSAFTSAGKDLLYRAIQAAQLRETLAAELSLQLPPNGQLIKRRWTDAAIKAALDDLLVGRDTWPLRREFEEAGLGGLYEMLRTTGRRQEWRDRYGVAMKRRQTQPA